MRLFPSLSGRNVDPFRYIPAKSPRDRESGQSSARNAASVAALASGPTGPAAAEIPAPSAGKEWNSRRGHSSPAAQNPSPARPITPKAAAFKRHHGGRAPRTVNYLPAAAGHHATAVAAAKHDAKRSTEGMTIAHSALSSGSWGDVHPEMLRISDVTMPAFSIRSALS